MIPHRPIFTPIRFVMNVLLALSVSGSLMGGEFEVDDVMYTDPVLPQQPTKMVFSKKYKPLWLQALRQPKAELQLRAASTIGLAHTKGMPDLADTADDLVQVLESEDQNPLVKVAVAQTLVILESKSQASVLMQYAGDSKSMARTIEPALGRWGHRPLLQAWQERIQQPSTDRESLLLAIRGLAVAGVTAASDPLLKLVNTVDLPADVRLAAAASVGQLKSSELEAQSQQYADAPGKPPIVGQLIAAHLLATHEGDRVVDQLASMTVAFQPAAAAISGRRLLALDAERCVSLADRLSVSPDAKLRQLAAASYVARPTGERMSPLSVLMDDVHPEVRRYARVELQRLADQPELLQPILAAAMEMLGSGQWRGLEQSGLLLGALDHKPAADRLVELLDYEREEVGVAAAWALRKFQIAATLPAMLRRAQKNKTAPIGGSEQQEQLFQAFGLMRYQPADKLLQTYIPKGSGGPRVGAIWALGHLYDGKNPPELVKKLAERVADESTFPLMELPEVKTWASVSIGRMLGRSALPTLRRYWKVEGRNSEFGQATAWAIHQMTGEPIPKPTLGLTTIPNWFLRPLD